jgi:hypothetical protein
MQRVSQKIRDKQISILSVPKRYSIPRTTVLSIIQGGIGCRIINKGRFNQFLTKKWNRKYICILFAWRKFFVVPVPHISVEQHLNFRREWNLLIHSTRRERWLVEMGSKFRETARWSICSSSTSHLYG